MMLNSCIIALSLNISAISQIQPDANYPQYWNFRGEPTLLLGASDEDNLFQLPQLHEHLQVLKNAGGNYVRCTMSSRDEGNRWPFYFDPEKKKYDLNQWDTIYWQRFERFLKLCDQLDIVIQIEIWATFDYYREPWSLNPFNPKNNGNYSSERTKLPDTIETHPVYCDNPFFWSIPMQDNNMPVLRFQQRFVDKILSYTLHQENILYCIDNETSVTASWGRFWSTYLKKIAKEQGRKLMVTEMWDPHELDHISHRESFDHPEIYDYVDISQNNHQLNQNHWRNGLFSIDRLKEHGNLRPVNNVKIYGSDHGRHGGNDQDAIEKFVRNILMGCASARFHRPPSGLGLSDTTSLVIRNIQKVVETVPFFSMEPEEEIDRVSPEGYVRKDEDDIYIIYLPKPGNTKIMLDADGPWKVERFSLLDDQESTSDFFNGSQFSMEVTKRHQILVFRQEP